MVEPSGAGEPVAFKNVPLPEAWNKKAGEKKSVWLTVPITWTSPPVLLNTEEEPLERILVGGPSMLVWVDPSTNRPRVGWKPLIRLMILKAYIVNDGGARATVHVK